MPSFDLGLTQIQYVLVKGNSRRYTYFRFRPDLTLEVILPRGKTIDVEKVIWERRGWLRREFARASMTRTVLEGEAVMFGGRSLKAVFIDSAEDVLTPDESNGVVVVRTADRRRFRELVRRWFLRESSAYAVRKVSELAPVVGARPAKVDVREMGKWGYCTRGGRISFSWQLIALPERLREYIVLHELTHLHEFNHSKSFRNRMAAVCVDFRDRERELDLIVPFDRLGPPG